MKGPLPVYVGGYLLLVSSLLVGGWSCWRTHQSPVVWRFLDPPEKTLSGVSVGQEVKVTFRLKNTAQTPAHIWGASAC